MARNEPEPAPAAERPAAAAPLSAEDRALVERARKAFHGRKNLPKAPPGLQDRMQSEAGYPDE